jgi:hypothetical protein
VIPVRRGRGREAKGRVAEGLLGGAVLGVRSGIGECKQDAGTPLGLGEMKEL